MLKEQFDIFEACRLFDPSRGTYLASLGVQEVERQLKLVTFFSAHTVAQLVAGWAAHVVYVCNHAPGLDGNGNVPYEAWWVRAGAAGNEVWFESAKRVMLLQPSSAAAERVFSMLKALMGDQQMNSALVDYQEASIMLHYNQGERFKYLVKPASHFRIFN